jgi:hypothetical protein
MGRLRRARRSRPRHDRRQARIPTQHLKAPPALRTPRPMRPEWSTPAA